jgi:hypothetical protein
MKIYDVFSFYNEFDVLEIRLKELWNTVDYFVLVESNTTFTGLPKEYFFENNKERFAPYLEKILHIKLDDSIEEQRRVLPGQIDDTWVREKYQRYIAYKELTDVAPEDLLIISDCDEIPRADMIEMIRDDENDYDRYIVYVAQFNYKINYMKIQHPSSHPAIIVTRGRVFTNPQQEREYSFYWNAKPANTVSVHHGGWHFTYFGNEDHCLNKIKSFAHTEQNIGKIVNEYNIAWMIRNKYGHEGIDSKHNERFEYVVVNDYFPKCITENLEQWSHMIIPDAEFRVEDLYRENEKY